MRLKKKNEQGFTLVELLVAVLLLAVGLLGVLALLPMGNKQVTSSARVSALNHLGQKQLDYLRALPFAAGDLTADQRHPSAAPLTLNEYPGYTIVWYVDQDADFPAGTKQITVEVGYQLYQTGTYNVIASNQTADQRVARFRTYISQ